MTRLLEIEDLSTGYNGAAVVRHLDLHVDEGEVVALLGPNGAGKTTTLLTVSQLVPIIAGDIRVMGESVDGVRPHLVARRGLAHVPEDRSLFFQLTVAENLRLGGSRGGADLDRPSGTSPLSNRCSIGGRASCPAANSRCWRWRGRSPRSRSC